MMEWYWWVLIAAGISVGIIASLFIIKCLQSIKRYYDWKRRYQECITEVERRQFCEQKVIVVNGIQLWYIKDDEDLWIPLFFILNSKIWMSHGPTKGQSEELMGHFRGNETIPILFIGRLVYYTEEDREGLKQLKNERFKLEVWKKEADKVHPMYATYLENYLQKLSWYHKDILTIAHAELNVTHITTDKGNLYGSTRYKHAEIVLIERTEPQDVRTIWIDNSPCTDCSNRLVRHFKQESNKPTINVGKLYERDPDGMKPLVTSGFTLQSWDEYIKYAGWTVQYSHIVKKIKELVNYVYSENEAVQLAVDNRRGTVLWINETQVLINLPGGVHAEILLINSSNKAWHPRTIKTIHIENSPCRDCSKALIQYFRYCHPKPTILIGQIWHRYSEQDDEGLKNMMRAGFKFQVWQAMHDRRHRGDTTTRNYLDRLMRSL